MHVNNGEAVKINNLRKFLVELKKNRTTVVEGLKTTLQRMHRSSRQEVNKGITLWMRWSRETHAEHYTNSR